MAIGATSAASNRVYVNAPAGAFQGVLVDVIDDGMVTNPKFGKTQHKATLVWQLNELITREAIIAASVEQGREVSEDDLKQIGRRYTVRKQYTLSTDVKAGLRKDAKILRGRDMTPEEVKFFDVEGLLGINAMVNVVREAGKSDPSKMYSNIASVSPWPTQFGPPITGVDYKRKVERDAERAAGAASA